MGYNLDLVICIDGTGSMRSIIERIKQEASRLPDMIREGMESAQKEVDRLRLKVIVFRDYAKTNEEYMKISSGFYDADVITEAESFQDFLRGVTAKGGGDKPENALEAIALALKSEWTQEGGRYKRHIVAVFTDTDPVPLQLRAEFEGYPAGMPADLDELRSWFEEGSQDETPDYSPQHGRLIVFAPETEMWVNIRGWPRTWLVTVKPDGGLEDLDLQDAIDVIVAST